MMELLLLLLVVCLLAGVGRGTHLGHVNVRKTLRKRQNPAPNH